MDNELKKIASEELLELYKQIEDFLGFLDKENKDNEMSDDK